MMTSATLSAATVARAAKSRISKGDMSGESLDRLEALGTLAATASDGDSSATVSVSLDDFQLIYRVVTDRRGANVYSTFIGNG